MELKDNYTDGNFKPGQFNASYLGNLKYIFEDILAGDPQARNRPEFTCLNLKAVQAALDWLEKNDQLSITGKADLALNSWRLAYKDKPPTPEEFLTSKFIGPQAEGVYPHIRKAFTEFLDPLKPFDTAVLYMCIGSGKDQPISSDVAVGCNTEVHLDLGKKILHLPADTELSIKYDGVTQTIKAKDLEYLDLSLVDLPEPVVKKFRTNLNMKIYDVNLIHIFDDAKDIISYTELINYFKAFNRKSFYDANNIYCHLHHIIPRSEGGSDNPENLVYLPYRYHVKAHYLLGKEKEQMNDRKNAMANYKAVSYALSMPSVPKTLREVESKLDYVLDAMARKGLFEKQTIWIKKEGQKSIRIFEEEFENFEKDGWSRGRNFKTPSNKVWVNKDNKNYYIPKQDLEKYISNGYIKGMFKTDQMKKSNHRSYSTKGTKWMTSPTGEAKAIPAEDVDNRLRDGWTLGHKRWVFTKGTPHKKQGFHWFTDGKTNILALDCPEGWRPGRV